MKWSRLWVFLLTLPLSGCAGVNASDKVFIGFGSALWAARRLSIFDERHPRKKPPEADMQPENLSVTPTTLPQARLSPTFITHVSTSMDFSQIQPTPVLTSEPTQAESSFLAAKDHFRRFRYALCLKEMETLSSQFAGNAQAEALFYAGVCAFYLGRRADAERMFSMAAEVSLEFAPDPGTFTHEVVSLYQRFRSGGSR